MAGPSIARPTGRPGQALALLLLALLGVAAWQGVAAPLLSWYADGAEALAQREALAGRMERLAGELPALQRLGSAATASSGPGTAGLLAGTSDAVAGAALQQMVQDMARRAGATLGSTEALPAEPAGRYRRIAIRVSTSAPWPALVALLRTIGEASPAMLVDDLQLHASRAIGAEGEPPMDATLTVLGFLAADHV